MGRESPARPNSTAYGFPVSAATEFRRRDFDARALAGGIAARHDGRLERAVCAIL